MPTIHLRVITPERTLLDEDVAEVTLQTKNGQISILPNHMPLISEVEPGEIIVKNKIEDHVVLVYGGFIYVRKGSEVLILADAAEHLDELSEIKIEEAKQRAEQIKKSATGNKEMLAEAEAELSRIATQLKSLDKNRGIHRRHHRKL